MPSGGGNGQPSADGRGSPVGDDDVVDAEFDRG
jgi:molecular chaperone DnaK